MPTNSGQASDPEGLRQEQRETFRRAKQHGSKSQCPSPWNAPPDEYAKPAVANGRAQKAWLVVLRTTTERHRLAYRSANRPSSSIALPAATSAAYFPRWRARASTLPRFSRPLREQTSLSQTQRADPQRQRLKSGAKRSLCGRVRPKPTLRAAASSPHLQSSGFIREHRWGPRDAPAFCRQ